MLFYTGQLGKFSLRKMIFEQKPEVKERENHSRIQIHIFLTERTSTKALVEGSIWNV